MPKSVVDRRPHLLVLASTFPRWQHDSVPDFVLQFVQHVMPAMDSATVIAPHFPGAKTREVFPEGILVKRFRYALPARFENLAYAQFKKTRFYPLKVLCYALAEFRTTLLAALRRQLVVINAHWLIPQGFIAVVVGQLIGARVVISVHGSDVFTLNGKFMRKIKRFALQRADAVVVNSSATQAACTDLWPGRDYLVIPMGINLERFAKTTKTQTIAPTNDYTILFVGRLAKTKGVIYLCEAVKQLHVQHKDARLDIIGEGPERSNIEQYIRDQGLEGVITLLGWVQQQDLPAYYHRADVFVAPSITEDNGRQEAFGLVCAEASAAGLPVVATDSGGMRDVVVDHVTGLIVPQKQPVALAEALGYLYTHRDEARGMGQKGSKHIRTTFSWDTIARRYLAVLNPDGRGE